LLGRGQCVVGEGRDGCGRGPQRIPDDLVVTAGAQQDPDRRGMPVRSAQLVVDHRDVEPERPDVVVPELADLELDDDVAELLDVEQQQVDEIPRSEFLRLFRFSDYPDLRVGPAPTTRFGIGRRNSPFETAALPRPVACCRVMPL
jgi:hypothetical protein